MHPDAETASHAQVTSNAPVHKIVLPEQQLELVPVVLGVCLLKMDWLAALLWHLVVLYENLCPTAPLYYCQPSSA